MTTVRPTLPPVPDQALRSNPATFNDNAEQSIQFMFEQMPTYGEGILNYTAAMADDALKIAAGAVDVLQTLDNGTTLHSALHYQAKAQGNQTAAETALGDVTSRQADVVTRQTAIEGIQTDVTTKQADVTSRQADVTTRQADVTSKQDDVTAKLATVTTLEGQAQSAKAGAETAEGNAQGHEAQALIHANNAAAGFDPNLLPSETGDDALANSYEVVMKDATGNVVKTISYERPIGYGQTWQDVTASRSLNTVYPNDTGQPIVVVMQRNEATTATVLEVSHDNLTFISVLRSRDSLTVTAIIPSGHYYKLTNASPNIVRELRA